jgi:hypothetical protein
VKINRGALNIVMIDDPMKLSNWLLCQSAVKSTPNVFFTHTAQQANKACVIASD